MRRTAPGRAPAELIDTRLAPDMLPCGYRVKSCAAQSIGGIQGVGAGIFSPDREAWPTVFAGLRDALQTVVAVPKAIDRDAFDALAGAFGQTRLPDAGPTRPRPARSCERRA